MKIQIIRPRTKVREIPVGRPFTFEGERYMVVQSTCGGVLTQQLMLDTLANDRRLVVELETGEIKTILRDTEIDPENPPPKLQEYQSIPPGPFIWKGGTFVKSYPPCTSDRIAINVASGVAHSFQGNEMVELVADILITTL